MTGTSCPLCAATAAERMLWRDTHCRVIDVGDADYPGYCRVVWNSHAREMTDLRPEQREHLMNVVYATEESLRALLHPHKVNLAALGNQVPHLHWHVVPRFPDDPHYPDPIWGTRRRRGVARAFDVGEMNQRLARRLERRS